MTSIELAQTGPAWWATVGIVAGLGLVIGSFLNVVAWRVPRDESIVSPPSACPGCGHPVRARDNVPVLSWLLLRGRCRDCGEPISRQYPIVEVATAVLFVLVLWTFGVSLDFVVYAYLAALGVALTVIDLSVRRLPDLLVLPAYAVLAVLFVVQCALSGDWWPLARAVIGGASLFVFYFGAALVYPGGMGFGDVKLAGVIGAALAWLGWGPLVVGSFAAFLLGGLVGVVLILARRASRRSAIPFGPWMIAGAAVGVAWGTPVWDGYTRTWS